MNTKIENDFNYHEPDAIQEQKYSSIREKAKELAYEIDKLCSDSEEKSNAMNRLEEATMWANASVARHSFKRPRYCV